MAMRGFTRRLQRSGAWFERLALGDDGTAPVFPPLYIKPTSAPTTAAAKGDAYVDTNGVLNVHNGTNYVPGGSGNVVVPVDVPNAAAAIDQNAFIADRAYQLTAVRGVFSVTNGAAFTVDVKKCTGTQAPASGVTMLTSTQDWNTTANTVISSTITATSANAVLAAGDRIALDFTGSATSIAGGVVLLVLRPI